MATRIVRFTGLATSLLMLAGCGTPGDDSRSKSSAEAQDMESAVVADPPAEKNVAPAAGIKPASEPDRTAKIGGPVTVAYRIVGQPVVGQPLSVDLRVTSALGEQPVRLDYRILDASALRLAEAQAPFATVAQAAGADGGPQQVTVVPLREGRLYLNVAATVETAEGSMSTVTAIPIQVGESRRELRDNGTLETRDDGTAVRVLEGSDD